MPTPTWEETSPLTSDADTPVGLIEPGNIDLTNRPIVRHPDGSYSTVKSASFNFDGQEVLLPTVSDTGEMLSNDDAISLYKKTGKHLGKFSTPEAATDYAKQLHESQAKLYDDRANAPSWDETEPVNPQISTQPWQQPGADLGPFGGYAPFAPGRLAHMEEAQDILRAPGAALGAALEPVQETVSRVASDFLNRTGLDPSAMPGRNIVQLPHVSGTGVPSAVINRLSDIGSGFTEPGQAATLPFLAFKPVQAAFAAQSLAALPESARELAQAGTLPEAAAALTSGGVNALIARQLGKSLTEGAPNAVETREIPQGDLIEHPRTEEVGVRPQAGGGDSPERVPTWEETVAVEPPKEVTAAAFTNPETGETTTAPSHIEAATKQGVEAPKEPEARQTPEFGYEVQTPTGETQVVSREEGGEVAKESGQLKEEPKTGVAHSNEIAMAPPKGLATTPPAELQIAIVPGAKEFIEQDLGPTLEKSAKVIGETASQVKSLLSPPSMGKEAEVAAGIAREAKAELAQKDLQAREKFGQAKNAMDSLSKPQSLSFIDSIERGNKLPTPEAQTLADSLRSEFDKRVDQVRALGTGKLKEVYEHYFPHIWKDPEAAVSWYSRILGRRPLRGPASFLKHRQIDFTTDGVAAGLEPVSWNPIELSLLKMHEMDRYVMGQKIFNEFKEKGLAEFSRSDIPPEGMAKIDDRIGNVVEYRPTVKADGTPGAPERIIRGHWYAQEDASRVLNNFLSPGLERFAWYRALRWTGNTLNLAQLGLSGYHFLFTMLDSSTAKLALGLEQVERGDFGKGAVSIAKGIAGIPGLNQLEYFLKGSKVLEEYTKPGSVGGDYANVVDALLAGGGRTEMPKIFKNSSLENFMTALSSGNYPGALIRAPFAAIQAISHPLMQVIVPRLKLGSFADMARYEIEKMGPNVSRDEFRKSMGKIWDSVDNRMGEMVYDNLFWNRTLKDTSFLAVRAVGWNLGTIRELGGSLVDSTTLIKRLRAGDPAVTRRMNYAIALPITVGIAGAMYQYLKTGKGPQELRDCFYPKTGKTLPDGTEERVNFPSYLKDVYSYKTHPGQTVAHKLHPMWSAMYQMMSNRDYYGTQIRNPDDPLVKQIGEELGFVAKQFVPFSVKGDERRVEAKESPEVKAESFMGIMPIPPEIARTAAQNKIMEYGIARLPKGAHTQEEQDRFELKRDLESQIQSPKDYEKARDQLKVLARQGNLTRGQQVYEQNKLRFEQSQISGGRTKSEAQWLWRFKHLSLPEARHVYEVATPQEQKLFNRDLKLKEKKAAPE